MYDVAIIGGGPAGASAAIFTARAGLDTVVVDGDKGVTRRAMLHNHLGFPEGITGPDLVDRGRSQAERSGAKWIGDDVESLRPVDGGFMLTTAGGTSVEAKEIILTLGTSARLAEAAGIPTMPGTEPRINTIVPTDEQGRTALDGVWAAGIVAGVSPHTIVTAGDGARVAINLISARNGSRHIDHDILPAG